MNEDCSQYLETKVWRFYPGQPVLAPHPKTGEKVLARLVGPNCTSCQEGMELERGQVIPDAEKEYEAAKAYRESQETSDK